MNQEEQIAEDIKVFDMMVSDQVSFIERILAESKNNLPFTFQDQSEKLIGYFEELKNWITVALEIYCYRIKKYIGSYLAVLGDVDAIVMTAGVGENDSYVREHALSGLTQFGIELDRVKNQADVSWIKEIQSENSRIKLLVIPTNEEKQIAISCLEFV